MARKKDNRGALVGLALLGIGGLLLYSRASKASPEEQSRERELTIAERIAGLGPDWAEPPEDVVLLKELLGAWGFDPGPLTPVYNVATINAVKEFQQENGLTPTGSVDGETPHKIASKDLLLQKRNRGVAGLVSL